MLGLVPKNRDGDRMKCELFYVVVTSRCCPQQEVFVINRSKQHSQQRERYGQREKENFAKLADKCRGHRFNCLTSKPGSFCLVFCLLFLLCSFHHRIYFAETICLENSSLTSNYSSCRWGIFVFETFDFGSEAEETAQVRFWLCQAATNRHIIRCCT